MTTDGYGNKCAAQIKRQNIITKADAPERRNEGRKKDWKEKHRTPGRMLGGPGTAGGGLPSRLECLPNAPQWAFNHFIIQCL